MRRCCAYEFCARDFTPRRRDQIYCCAACNKRRYAQRHKAKVLRMNRLAQRRQRARWTARRKRQHSRYMAEWRRVNYR